MVSTKASRRPGPQPVRDRPAAGCPLSTLLLLLVVFLLGIERPQIIAAADAGGDVVDSDHGGKHGMVLIVVLVHAVPTDEEEIVEGVGVGDDFRKPVVGS